MNEWISNIRDERDQGFLRQTFRVFQVGVVLLKLSSVTFITELCWNQRLLCNGVSHWSVSGPVSTENTYVYWEILCIRILCLKKLKAENKDKWKIRSRNKVQRNKKQEEEAQDDWEEDDKSRGRRQGETPHRLGIKPLIFLPRPLTPPDCVAQVEPSRSVSLSMKTQPHWFTFLQLRLLSLGLSHCLSAIRHSRSHYCPVNLTLPFYNPSALTASFTLSLPVLIHLSLNGWWLVFEVNHLHYLHRRTCLTVVHTWWDTSP